MSGEQVEIKTDRDGVADGYLARPTDIQTAVGLVCCSSSTRSGYVPRSSKWPTGSPSEASWYSLPTSSTGTAKPLKLAMPDLEDPEARAPFMEKLRPMMQELTPEVIASDSQGYLDFLAGVARAPFAITGYCMGARLGWRIATAHPDRVTALAGFHGGGLVTDDEDSPHHSSGELTAEVYLGHADNDHSMTPENIAALEQALDEADVTYRSEVYAGAAHGYTMADTAMYDEGAAERHFDALFALLDRAI